MSFFKNILHDLYLYLVWIVVAWIGVGFIFSRLTDTSVEKKIVICVSAECSDRLLDAKLEEQLPDGIKMIRVHNFDYYMFDDDEIQNVDFFIIPESEMETYVGAAMSIENLMALYPDLEYYSFDGIPVGIKVHTAGEEGGAAAGYISYTDENYYLLFNGGSTHSKVLNDSADNKAIEVMENFLSIK